MTMPRKEKIAIVLSLTGLLAVVGAFVTYGHHITPPAMITNTMYVATPGGIAYEVKAMHRCGEGNMRKAAIHATHNQTGDMRFEAAERILEAVAQDWTRIYEGNIYSNRCEIKSIKFTNITGKAYIVKGPE